MRKYNLAKIKGEREFGHLPFPLALIIDAYIARVPLTYWWSDNA